MYLETTIKLLQEKEARYDQSRLDFEAVNCSSGNLQKAQDESVYVGLAVTHFDMGVIHELLLDDRQQAQGQFELTMSIFLKKVNPEELTYESAICWGVCSDYTDNELAEEGTQRALKLSILINITNYHLDLLRRKSGDNQEAKENHKCALSSLQLMRMFVSTFKFMVPEVVVRSSMG